MSSSSVCNQNQQLTFDLLYFEQEVKFCQFFWRLFLPPLCTPSSDRLTLQQIAFLIAFYVANLR